MPYRLRANESVRRGIRRVSASEIEYAIEQLTNGKDRDEAIHDARKAMKKVRGALRLVRFDLGKRFQEENAFFGGIGRKLSELRDATAMLEIFHDLVKHYKSQLAHDELAFIRQGLEDRKRHFEAEKNIDGVMHEVIDDLRAALLRVGGWPLHSNGFAAVAPGLSIAFKAGRRAFAAAYENPAPENFHELRKRAKDHWYHIRLLENLWTPVMEAYESALKDLEQRLGDDHNLVVLRQLILADPSHFKNQHELQTLSKLMDSYQEELRLDARNMGERIYGQKPRELVAQIQHLWEAWKHEAERTWARRTLPAQTRTAAATPA